MTVPLEISSRLPGPCRQFTPGHPVLRMTYFSTQNILYRSVLTLTVRSSLLQCSHELFCPVPSHSGSHHRHTVFIPCLLERGLPRLPWSERQQPIHRSGSLRTIGPRLPGVREMPHGHLRIPSPRNIKSKLRDLPLPRQRGGT